MEEFNVHTPEGLRRFLLAEAQLDDDLYSEECLKSYLKDNSLDYSEYLLVLGCLGTIEA